LHGALIAAFLSAYPAEPNRGAGGQYLEAIEVEVVQSAALESLQKAIDPEKPAAASERVTPSPEPVDQTTPKGDEARPLPNESEVLPAPDEPTPEPQPTAIADDKVPESGQPAPRMHDAGHTEELPISMKSEAAQQPTAEMQAFVRADPSPGRTAASPGAMQRYAAQVRAILARNKPKGRGRRGTAVITFAISASGKVRSANVTESSGNPNLDKSVLAAIERTTFPPPPAGMTENQLTYQVPFVFK
jgi:protein TonB